MQALWQHCRVCIPALIAALLGWSHGRDHQNLARTLTVDLHLQGLAALGKAGRKLQDLERLEAHVLCSALFRAREHLTPSELVDLSSLLHRVPGTLAPQCSAGRRDRGLLVHIVSHYVLTGAAGAHSTACPHGVISETQAAPYTDVPHTLTGTIEALQSNWQLHTCSCPCTHPSSHDCLPDHSPNCQATA